MSIKNTFELALMLDAGKFHEILTDAYDTAEQLKDDEYIDNSMDSKGITVVYRDSKYTHTPKHFPKAQKYDIIDQNNYGGD